VQEDREDLQEFISRCTLHLQNALEEQRKLELYQYKKHNDKPRTQAGRQKYEKTEKGLYSRSKINFNRRTRFENACENLTWEEKKAIGRFYKNCPKGYEVDHIYPIAKGGKHTISNLQYLTAEENKRKGAKLDYKYE